MDVMILRETNEKCSLLVGTCDISEEIVPTTTSLSTTTTHTSTQTTDNLPSTTTIVVDIVPKGDNRRRSKG